MTSSTYPATEAREVDRDANRRRWVAGGLAVAFHLGILALFLGSHPPLTTGQGVGAGAMDVSLAGFSRGAVPSPTHAAAAAAAPPAKPAPPAPADPIKPRTVVQIVSDILTIPLAEHTVTPQPLFSSPAQTLAQAVAPASGSPGAACDIGGAVQAALRTDPEAHGAVLLIPRKARSAADAILLWNGQWVDPAEVGGVAAFAPVRVAIRQIVASANPDCRAQEIVGPRFMLIPDGEATMVVVLGTASWRWADLLVDPPAAAQTASD